MSGFTPGPWHVDASPFSIGKPKHLLISGERACDYALAKLVANKAESEANARLIAAAPDLHLAAMSVWNNVLNGDIEATTKQASNALADLRAAIAKATLNASRMGEGK